jgi:hypothetical protein
MLSKLNAILDMFGRPIPSRDIFCEFSLNNSLVSTINGKQKIKCSWDITVDDKLWITLQNFNQETVIKTQVVERMLSMSIYKEV